MRPRGSERIEAARAVVAPPKGQAHASEPDATLRASTGRSGSSHAFARLARSRFTSGWIAAGLLAVACDTVQPVLSCEGAGASTAAASAPDRRLIGAGHEYPGDGMLASRWDELRGSQRARRAAAWEVIARVLAPVAVAQPTSVPDAAVPRFRTWYDDEDVTRIFRHAYERLSPAARADRARIPEAAIDAAIEANLHVLDGMAAWTDERWAEYVARIEDREELAAVGGIRRIAISPEAARHVVRSYPEILRCFREGSPPPFLDGDPAERTLVREPIAIEPCASYVAGPFWIATEGTLDAHLEGAVAGATMRVLVGPTLPGAIEACTGPGDLGCEATGPGAAYIEVRASGRPVSGRLIVGYRAPDVPESSCLDGSFPLGAATVAQHWQRVELGPLPTFDTRAEAIAAHLAEDATWGAGDGQADPGPDEIFTIRVPAGGTYRLAGMHIRTRELDRWVNVTMWWTPTPEETFGADRPDSIRALGGPWAHYAMCVSIDDVERDPDPAGGFTTDHPSLAAALRAARDESGSSWCSNPYIDAAPGLVRSNCVGCHQHAMSGIEPGEVVMDETRYPLGGRAIVRNNFPSDHFWGLDAGDDLANVIADTVEYWEGTGP